MRTMLRANVCRLLLPAFLLFSLATIAGAQQRPYRMGFTPWPPDFTHEAVAEVYNFIAEHADLIAHHFDNGVPWQEAYENRPYPASLQNNWLFRKLSTPAGHAVLVAITPISFERTGLALRWGEYENMPLPPEWAGRRFNDPKVKKAFLNYARSVVEYFHPDYLAIGIESNILVTNAPDLWKDYLDLHAYVYQRLKREFPGVKIFASIQYEHLRGIETTSRGLQDAQRKAVAELLRYCDLMALSTYHFGLYHNPYDESYFDAALSFGKPLAISETGAMSADIQVQGFTLPGTEADQVGFLDLVLRKAQELNFEFVVNFVAIDYDKLLHRLPPAAQESALAWVHTGLRTADGRDKAALSLWDSHLANPVR